MVARKTLHHLLEIHRHIHGLLVDRQMFVMRHNNQVSINACSGPAGHELGEPPPAPLKCQRLLISQSATSPSRSRHQPQQTRTEQHHRSRLRHPGDITGVNSPGIELIDLIAGVLVTDIGIEVPRAIGTGRILGTRPIAVGLNI